MEQAVLSWHSDAGIGSLLRYSLPRIESINQVAVRYVVDGWALEGVAWAERDAVQAIGLYNWKQLPQVKSLVYFVWVSQWDTEREIWERLTDLPEAVSRITQPGLSGSVALIGADRWAVTKALPMAIESLSASQVEPADLAAWTYAAGLAGCQRGVPAGRRCPATSGQPWPRSGWTGSSGLGSQRSLGKTKLSSIINACPWTRPDSRTLYRTLKLVGEHPGASIAHYGALAGESDSELISRKRLGTLLDLGLAREAEIAGVANLGTPDRPEVLSARGRGQMRYRVSLGPKGEEEPAKRKPGESKEDHTRRTANGAFRIMLDHGELSYREIVRRSGVGKLEDRLADRLGHEDILVDVLGRLTVLGCEVVPASRARTVDAEGYGIDPDAMLYCTSPVGTGYHFFELELSHLNPGEIEPRMKKYSQRRTSYPLAVVCKTDLGARHFDRIGQRDGGPRRGYLSPPPPNTIGLLRPGLASSGAGAVCNSSNRSTPACNPATPACSSLKAVVRDSLSALSSSRLRASSFCRDSMASIRTCDRADSPRPGSFLSDSSPSLTTWARAASPRRCSSLSASIASLVPADATRPGSSPSTTACRISRSIGWNCCRSRRARSCRSAHKSSGAWTENRRIRDPFF